MTFNPPVDTPVIEIQHHVRDANMYRLSERLVSFIFGCTQG